jgi:hypothetical protein
MIKTIFDLCVLILNNIGKLINLDYYTVTASLA